MNLLEGRVRGGLLGLALGDALTFAHDKKTPRAPLDDEHAPPLMHGATTTWALTVLDALTCPRGGLSFHESLVARLEALASVREGRALRGSPRDIAGTLRDVAKALGKNVDRRRCGSAHVVAHGVVSALPLAFALGDEVESIAAAVVDSVSLTHRHPRVVSSAALWVGGLRHALATREVDREALLAAGQAVARIAIALVADSVDDARGPALSEAEGALAMACAAATFVDSADELLSPPGFDGSDMPERIACAGLVMPSMAHHEAHELLDLRASSSDGHVVVPLLMASWGLCRGVEALPLDLLSRLASRDLVETRAHALWDERALPWLLEEELALASREPTTQAHAHMVTVAPTSSAKAKVRAREQMRLL